MAKRKTKDNTAELADLIEKSEKKKKPAAKKKVKISKTETSKPVKKIASKKAKKDETRELADIVIKGIKEKKGKNTTCLNLKNIHSRVCDYFIICEGDSTTHVGAIADSVEEEVRKATGEKPYRSEGYENSEWILIDYVDVVVHIFQKEIRSFYKLEALWADAEIEEHA